MSHFQRRSDSLVGLNFNENGQSETSFSTLVPTPTTYNLNLPYPEAPKSNFLPLDHPQLICLNSITQTRHNLSEHQVVTCNCPNLAQSLSVDVAKSQLYDDPHNMHMKLIKLHTTHSNLKIDLAKIIEQLDEIPTFHPPHQQSIRTWFRKSRVALFASFSGLVITIIAAIMIYIVVKLQNVLYIFG